MKKIFLSFFLFALLLIIGNGVIYASTSCKPFTDVDESHVYCGAINYLKDFGVIEGYDDGTFLPENNINRAEFVKFIMSLFYSDDEAKDCLVKVENIFLDVNKSQWYAGPTCLAQKQKIISGYGDGNFKPALNISFAESAKILSLAFNLAGTVDVNLNQSDPWYKKYVDLLASKKAIPLSIDKIDEQVSREEVAEMVYRLFKKDISKLSETYATLTGVNDFVLEQTSQYEEIIDIFDIDFAIYAGKYLEGDFSFQRFEFVKGKNYFYAVYSDENKLKKLLFSYESDLSDFEIEAYYEEGDQSDFVKLDGTDTVSSLEKEVYVLNENGDLSETINLQEGYIYFESSSYHFRVQFPKDWYYASDSVSGYNFSDQPVESDNILLKLQIVEGSIDEYKSSAMITDEKLLLFKERNEKTSYMIESIGQYQDIAEIMLASIEATD